MFRELLLPSVSSQTTDVDFIYSGDEVIISIPKTSMNVGSAIIEVSNTRTWDKVMEDVLHDRAKTWEELANL
ncbi:MAG: hypothetical protein UZ14_CFX002001878 [Chloroflexi bacterium OLB14]|nr:MAG: hypothetical protein UZ14_CFX002001878 [Chloroflexi bacterium OLB14]